MNKDKRFFNEKSVDELKKTRQELKNAGFVAIIIVAIAALFSWGFYMVNYLFTAIILMECAICALVLSVGLILKTHFWTLMIYLKEHE